MGSVEDGKNADLVLLDADPTQSSRNLSMLAGVVLGGRFYSRADLDQLKMQVISGHGYLH